MLFEAQNKSDIMYDSYCEAGSKTEISTFIAKLNYRKRVVAPPLASCAPSGPEAKLARRMPIEYDE